MGDPGAGWIGRSVQRREDKRLLLGDGTFVADIVRPNMAHACFARSQLPHAKIKSVDLSTARAAPGALQGCCRGWEKCGQCKPLYIAHTFCKHFQWFLLLPGGAARLLRAAAAQRGPPPSRGSLCGTKSEDRGKTALHSFYLMVAFSCFSSVDIPNCRE